MADIVNGLFESCGGIFILLSCYRLYRDKQMKGVSFLHLIFFTAWGFWNLYFYPQVGAWWSFYGGIGVVTTNSLYLGMMYYYSRKSNNAAA